MSFNFNEIRLQFPSLKRLVNGHPAIYFDSPGGTQTPQRVINKMVDYMINHNANSGGVFATTVENDRIIADARAAFADFLGCDAEEVAFGENSTTISFKLSQAIARDLVAGDEILITDMDHDANRSPWELLSERGIVIKTVRADPERLVLDLDDLKAKLSSKTRVVAFNYGSNAVGTISDAAGIIRICKPYNVITVVDAVHYALHGVIDVRKLDVDFLFCSAYKFFGPHIGVMYGKAERMKNLRTLKVSAQKNTIPDKFETGTLNHEAIAGAAEAIEFIADIGRHSDLSTSHAADRRANTIAGMQAIEDYEAPLAAYFKSGLSDIPGIRLFCPATGEPCTSTISFRLGDLHPLDVAKKLAEKGIFVWAGGFYAVGLMRTLGLSELGGMVRIGLAPYNTGEEIDRTLEAIRLIASEAQGEA